MKCIKGGTAIVENAGIIAINDIGD
jgi:hypothetical protein